MNAAERHDLLFRIFSGVFRCTLNNKIYVVKPPSIELHVQANTVYKRAVYLASFNETLRPKREVERLLVTNGIIPPNVEGVLKDIGEQENELKINMYKSYMEKDTLKKLRFRLDLVKKKQNELFGNQHMFDHLTPEGHADIVKAQWILSKSVFDEDDKPVWNYDADNVEYSLMDEIMGCINMAHITHPAVRELARHEPWRSYWGVGKETVFGKAAVDWTDEQRNLVSYSKMYDNIYENSDCPQDEIIEDDDVLDGWMLNLRKEREADKKRNQLEATLGEKHKGAGELYVMATNQEEAKEIFDLNTKANKQLIAQREKQIAAQGEVKDGELNDVRLEKVVKITRS